MYTCAFCGAELKSSLSRAAHQRFCKENPDYLENLRKHIETSIKSASIKNLNNHSPRVQRKEYEIKCETCGKSFTLSLTDAEFNSGKYKKCCSSFCAHKRVLTDETKEKIKNSIITNLIVSGKHVCGKASRKIPLHKDYCRFCNKPLFVKVDSESLKQPLACYECADKENVKRISIFDENGKRLVSDKTREKLKENCSRLIKANKWKGWTSRKIASYPEIFFKKVLEENKIKYSFNHYISKKELGVDEASGYFLDFKIGDNIDLEIDGKQHNYSDRRESDARRDALLKAKGWLIYRIPWNEINSEKGKQKMKTKIKDFLDWLHKQ